jgi:branched-chain amino acid transport system ATP-binding protein
MSDSVPIFECRDLVAGYGNTLILHGISLSIQQNETICIIGPSGSGKTTLLKTLAGWLIPQHGSILLDGKDVTKSSIAVRSSRGLRFACDSRAIFRNLTVKQNLDLARASSKRIGIDRQLEHFFPSFKDRARQLTGSLSGGQQQILSLWCALVAQPDILVADEFSEGLDTKSIGSMIGLIEEYRRRFPLSLLLVEPKISLARSLADRMVLLNRGTVDIDQPIAAFGELPEFEGRMTF